MLKYNFKFSIDESISKKRTTIEDVEEVEKWLTIQPFPKLTREQIVAFLISCDGKQDLAKRTITFNYAMKSVYPDFFTDRRVENEALVKMIDVIRCCEMPLRHNESAIIVSQMRDTNYQNYDFLAYVKGSVMILDTMMLRADPPDGAIIILDGKGFGIMHLTRVKLSVLKWFLQYAQEGMPMKIKSVHFINNMYSASLALNLAKPFLKGHLIQNIYIHSTRHMESFYENYVPKSCLPKEMGGELESIDFYMERSLHDMKSIQDYFIFEEQQRAQAVK